jgi:hypothetical protein
MIPGTRLTAAGVIGAISAVGLAWALIQSSTAQTSAPLPSTSQVLLLRIIKALLISTFREAAILLISTQFQGLLLAQMKLFRLV